MRGWSYATVGLTCGAALTAAIAVSSPTAHAQSEPGWGKAVVKPAARATTGALAKPTPGAAPAAEAAVPAKPAAPAAVVESQSHIPNRTAEFPKLVTPSGAAPAATEVWSKAEIEAAQKQCVDLLKGLDLVAVGAEPIKQGECGAAAPIELVSVGSNPQVTFSPTVIVTCEMAKALHTWVTRDLQGLARKNLGAPLIRVDTMSSYSCRTAYGRAKNRLSEHGKANAIDIRAFVTAKAETTDVQADWGKTQRAVQAEIAAAKAAQQKLEAEKAIAAAKQAPGQPTGATPSDPRAGAPTAVAGSSPSTPSLTIGVRGVTVEGPSAPSAIGLSTGMTPPSYLGGPKAAQEAPQLKGTTVEAPKAGSHGRRQFLHGAHQTACKNFGTVLGPEANRAHENHFHVDMAKRQRESFCE
jgi:hypothetical protein